MALTVRQSILANYMSHLSENAYCAGWMGGLEFALWEAVLGERSEYGLSVFTNEERECLRDLSQWCGGWIVWDDKQGETWVPIEEWSRRYLAWKGAQE